VAETQKMDYITGSYIKTRKKIIMSSSELVDIYDEQRAEHIAEQLGITYEELASTEYEIKEVTINDDTVVKTYVEFNPESPEDVMNKIEGLENFCVDINPFEFGAAED
jgi:hypothetical protein